MRAPAALLTFFAFCGCRPAGPRCTIGFVGDETQPVEVQPLLTDGASGTFAVVTPNQHANVEPPPQGGFVMYVGAAAKNLDACAVQLSGELRDPKTNEQVAFDARTTNLQLGPDGWARPDPSNPSNVSNVNACPDYTSQDIQGRTYELVVTVVDRGGRQGSASVPVVPTCAFSDSSEQTTCLCDCSAGYMLGTCVLDGGTSD